MSTITVHALIVDDRPGTAKNSIKAALKEIEAEALSDSEYRIMRNFRNRGRDLKLVSDVITDPAEFKTNLRIPGFLEKYDVIFLDNAFHDETLDEFNSFPQYQEYYSSGDLGMHFIYSMNELGIRHPFLVLFTNQPRRIEFTYTLSRQGARGAYDKSDNSNARFELCSLLIRLYDEVLRKYDNKELEDITRNLRSGDPRFETYSPELEYIQAKLWKYANVSDKFIGIRGELGTRKALYAKTMHLLSRRSQKPYQSVNCEAFSENLDAFRLHCFGDVYSGGRNRGVFNNAMGGTIYLENFNKLGNASIELVAEYFKTNTTSKSELHSQFIIGIETCPNDNGSSVDINNESFMNDIVICDIPPLRERVDDIEYIVKFCQERSPYSGSVLVTPKAVSKLKGLFEKGELLQGNDRQVQRMISEMILEKIEGEITPENLDFSKFNTQEETLSNVPEDLIAHISMAGMPRRSGFQQDIFMRIIARYPRMTREGDLKEIFDKHNVDIKVAEGRQNFSTKVSQINNRLKAFNVRIEHVKKNSLPPLILSQTKDEE